MNEGRKVSEAYCFCWIEWRWRGMRRRVDLIGTRDNVGQQNNHANRSLRRTLREYPIEVILRLLTNYRLIRSVRLYYAVFLQFLWLFT